MIAKEIVFFGNRCVLACDGRCDKAWGVTSRARVQLSDHPDNYALVADDDAEVAPMDPGAYEGGDAKPRNAAERLNKWCARECERSVMAKLPDFSARLRNIPEGGCA